MEVTSYEHGVPSWVDQSSPDVEGSAQFYAALFGWESAEGPAEAGGYRIATLRGKAVAGIAPQMNPQAPPAWLSYVYVDSADEIAEKVTTHGGATIVAPMDVLDLGRMAIFADPAGAVFGVWQPGTFKGAQLVNEPNTFCWSELITTDVVTATPFYAAVFGWGAESHTDPMPYTEWKVGGRQIGGMMPKPPTIPADVPPYWNVYFAVADLDAALKRIVELGGRSLTPPIDSPAGRLAAVADPSGAAFSVIQVAAASE